MNDDNNNDKKTQLVGRGFLERQSYQFKFTDVFEVIFAQILLCKIKDTSSTESVRLTFGMADLFSKFDHEDLANKKVDVRERMQEMLADTLKHMLGLELFTPKEQQIGIVEFYNKQIAQNLNYLLKGDNSGLKSCLEDVQITGEIGGFNEFAITLIPSKFVKVNAQNIVGFFKINQEFYQMVKGDATEIPPAVTYEKQLDFLIEALESRVSNTGETSFDFNIKDAKFRHVVSTSRTESEILTMPSPLSLNAGQRICLPLLLEVNGIIDINSIKIITPPSEINNIDIVVSIDKPAIKNRYLSDSYALSAVQRAPMNSTELQLYEDVYTKLSQAYIFGARKDIEENFSLFASWILRKMTYCLEEPSFIKSKALDWQDRNADKKYQQMEDEFFLPFIHEKLVDTFGELITKKPEKFGGEIDILFGNLPVELKVNKGKSNNLIDEIVDEKYRPASQAATYAAITRLGFVVVLDMPDPSAPNITNLSNCVKIIKKRFDNSEASTVIVVFVFYCNLPKPSLAK